MKSKDVVGFFRTGCLVLLAVMGLLQTALASDTNAAIGAQDFLRSYLQVQEQLHLTQLALEKSRQETAAAAVSNSMALDDRLQSVEKSVASQRLEQLNGLDRTVLIASCGFAAIGFVVLLLAAFLQWTSIHRLGAAAASLSATQALQGRSASEARLPTAQALEQSNTRFLGLMEQLQQRIQELESTANPPHVLSGSNSNNGHSNGSAAASTPVEISPPAAPDKDSLVKLLLGKGQTLLKLDQAGAALECLDEALTLDPGNAEVLVKKGAALERLQRFQEAIEYYDRAIARDNSMIMAHLYKGGVFNRLARHGEALACYEQALKPGKTANPQIP